MSDDGPTDGWAEPWPRVPDNDDAWSVFVRSLDPAHLNAERYRVHGNLEDERFGSAKSAADHAAHAYLAREFWRLMHDTLTESERAGEVRRRQAFAEADADRAIAAREERRRERARLEAARREHDQAILDMDETDILAALARYERDHPRNGHAA